MDVYTAFLIGVLVGQWVLLFAIWRAITKLVRLMNSPAKEPILAPDKLSDLIDLVEYSNQKEFRHDG